MPDAIGIPEEMLRQAARSRKIIDSDPSCCDTGTIRKYFNENPSHFDPRHSTGAARTSIKELVKNKTLTFSAATAKRNNKTF